MTTQILDRPSMGTATPTWHTQDEPHSGGFARTTYGSSILREPYPPDLQREFDTRTGDEAQVRALQTHRNLQVSADAVAALSPALRQALKPTISIVDSLASQSGLEISEISLSRFSDPEDDSQELVLNVTVVATPPQVMAYWNAVGRALDHYSAHLPALIANEFTEKLSVQVSWT